MGIEDTNAKIHAADKSKYKSIPVMTKYEFNQLIGLRTLQLSKGAMPFVDLPQDYQIKSNLELRKDIAIQEFKEGKFPLMVKRTLPDKTVEYWSIKDLDTCAIRHLLR